MAIGISPEAKAQILSLTEFYFKKHRPDAIDKLQRNIRFATNPLNLVNARFKPYPAKYSRLRYAGIMWLEHENYWFAFNLGTEPAESATLVAVIYATAGFRRQTSHLRPQQRRQPG